MSKLKFGGATASIALIPYFFLAISPEIIVHKRLLLVMTLNFKSGRVSCGNGPVAVNLLKYLTHDFNTVVDATGIRSRYDTGTSFGIGGSPAIHRGTADGNSVNVSHVSVRGAVV